MVIKKSGDESRKPTAQVNLLAAVATSHIAPPDRDIAAIAITFIQFSGSLRGVEVGESKKA